MPDIRYATDPQDPTKGTTPRWVLVDGEPFWECDQCHSFRLVLFPTKDVYLPDCEWICSECLITERG